MVRHELTEEEILREKNKKEVSINEFRKIVKEAGYKLKIETSSCMGNTYKNGSILDLEGNFIVGAGANVYLQETFDKHKKAFDLIHEYRVMDNGKKVRGL